MTKGAITSSALCMQGLPAASIARAAHRRVGAAAVLREEAFFEWLPSLRPGACQLRPYPEACLWDLPSDYRHRALDGFVA
jgi:hypothetical protein